MPEQPGLKVNYEQIKDAVVVTPAGEIAYSEAPIFRQWLKKASEAKPQRVVVDLSAVAYMNTPGVATLVEALQIAKKNRYRLILVGLNPNVRSVFEIARLHTVFELAESRTSALA
jgi:anti-sigma B factor antagonist